MLSLEEKLAIVESFPELQRKDVSLGRINFHYEDSVYDKKSVVYHLHPNGNGYVYAEFIKGYATDNKGLVNIRDFNEEELRSIIEKSILSLSGKSSKKAVQSDPVTEEKWVDEEGHQLAVTFVEDLWYVYAGSNLDCAFETYEEVEEYMGEEGFTKK
ncbi:hypothetical protein [Paenibacillus alba]|uniref:DUF4367 domain-containing protein n=1 Tax=Paenibacillus alba TaxID=1197127 RepID=A0ABU6FZ33_9BACL|nr:hypothetical protein [Paenibacillus alba]MEC0227165.1 hypothetical protein [Paenibacillus alba]NQX67720.1 hypothetical protein [Paenibacillus alba]